jgi:hypothetical protein
MGTFVTSAPTIVRVARGKVMGGDDLSLKGEVSCKERGVCKLPLLENYELSLMQKMKLSARCFALNVMILVVSKSIF